MNKPRVYIDRKVYNKIMHFVDKSDVEVSGMGKVVKGKGYFRVIDAVILPQSNGPTTTDITPEGMAKAEFLLKDQKGELNFWWHSHVNMGVFWSGTDTDTIQEIGRHGYLLATVFNKKREMRSAVHFENPFTDEALGTSVFLDELETYIYDGITDKDTALWNAEYDKNIIPKPAYQPRDWRENWVRSEAPGAAAAREKAADDLGNGPKLTKAQRRAARQEEKRAKKLSKRLGNTDGTVVDLRKTTTTRAVSSAITRSNLVSELDRLQAKKSMGIRHYYLMNLEPKDLPASYMGRWLKTPEDLEALQESAVNGAL